MLIQAAIGVKVTKERVGIEVSKMMHKNPLAALNIIDDLDLHASIFACDVNSPRSNSLVAGQILQRVLEEMPGDDMLWFAAAVTPFKGIRIGKRDAISVVLGDGLKVRRR
jgi:tRNA nucleotidyltransferase (CCA-adding enzyme)